MKQFLKDCLTGIDGQSYAIIKVLGFAVVVVFIGLEIAAFIFSKAFDGTAYGLGAGAAITAMGIAINLANKQEPPAKVTS